MEMVLSTGFCEMTMEENMLIDGGITTGQVAAGFVVVAGLVVGAVVGNAIGGPVGAAIGGEKGAKIGSVIGSIIVGEAAAAGTRALINGMANN